MTTHPTYGIVTQAPGHCSRHTVLRVAPAGQDVRLRDAEVLVDGIARSTMGFDWLPGMRLHWTPSEYRTGPGTVTVR